jgi:hypothetical protein
LTPDVAFQWAVETDMSGGEDRENRISPNRKKSRRPSIALLATATILAVLACLYPFSLIFSVPEWGIGLRWFQNTPVFSIFLFSAFPLSVLLLLEVSRELNSRLTARDRRLEIAIVALTLAAVTTAVEVNGFAHDPLNPHLFWLGSRVATDANTLEVRLRAVQFKTATSERLESEAIEFCTGKTDTECYDTLIHSGFGSIGRIFSEGSPAAWAMFVVSVLGALVVPWLITLVVLLVRNKEAGNERHVDLILLAFVLLLTFVPFRAYSDWYRDAFYRTDLMRTTLPFLILGALVMLIFGALVLRRRSSKTKLAFGLAAQLAGAVAAILSQRQWGWLHYVANAPPLQVFAVYVLFTVAMVLYAVSVREGALDTLQRD